MFLLAICLTLNLSAGLTKKNPRFFLRHRRFIRVSFCIWSYPDKTWALLKLPPATARILSCG